jgi:hypothetical protein
MIDRTLTASVLLSDLVRLGRQHDGGYVVPHSIVRSCDAVVGLGVHDDWSFEEALRSAMPVCHALHLYDPTTTHAFLRRRAIRATPKLITHALTFDRARLREDWARCSAPLRYRALLKSGAQHFHEWIAHEALTQHEPKLTSLRKAIERAVDRGATRIALKMDIEGGEYEAFASDWSRRVGHHVALLVVEFHDLDRTPERFNEAMRALTESPAATFVPVHIHANSGAGLTPCGFPAVPEITFVHRNLLPPNITREARNYPIVGLDQPTHRGECDLAFTA